MMNLSGDRYQVIRKLGEGGMATVYLARDCKLECEVVVKMPLRSGIDEPGFIERFAREIRSLVQLVHPHVVKVQDVDTSDGMPFYVMQYLAGGSLHDQPMPAAPVTLKKWLPSVAAALDFVHKQGYIHRDIKPANILFDSHDNAYISDFGVAKVLSAQIPTKGATQLTGEGLVVGTVGYVAPEIILAEGTIDGRADQYALAVTVYQVLSGRLPFEGASASAILVQQAVGTPPPLQQVAPGVPRPISDAVEKALSKEPQRRYPTCLAFAQAVLSAKAPPAASGTAQPIPKEPTPVSRPTSAAPPKSTATGKISAAPRSATLAGPKSTAPVKAADSVARRKPAPVPVKTGKQASSSQPESLPGKSRSVLVTGLLGAGVLGIVAGGFFAVRALRPATDSLPAVSTAAPVFHITPPQEVSVQAGKSAQVTIRIIRQGYEGVVRLIPQNGVVGVRLSEAVLNAGESEAILHLDVAAQTSGNIQVKVNAVGDGVEQSTTVPIRIVPPPQLRLIIPTSLPEVQLGAAAVSVQIEVVRIQCADQIVRYRVDTKNALEAGLLVQPSNGELKPGERTFTLRILPGGKAVPGTMVSLPVKVSVPTRKLEAREIIKLRIAAARGNS